ncbi:MAG: helix-turn-helix transcriptional regulator [Firmicutes bacterium]|nr:helix-turn-helix transcriptional regulator [Bacillota bacterium]
MLCQTLARWLSEIGNGTARVLEPSGLAAATAADAILLLLEDEADLALLQRLSALPAGSRPHRLLLFPELHWPLMERAAHAGHVDAIIGPPVSARLVRRVLDLMAGCTHHPRPLWVLAGGMPDVLPDAGPLPPSGAPPGGPVSLTPREREILTLLDRDYSNQEIAHLLVISPHTVKRHLEHLFRKLAVSSRMEAVHIAHRNGLLRTRRTDAAGQPRAGCSAP